MYQSSPSGHYAGQPARRPRLLSICQTGFSDHTGLGIGFKLGSIGPDRGKIANARGHPPKPGSTA